ncbi:IPT/TIG domain-containing protein [Nocardia xishanensis]
MPTITSLSPTSGPASGFNGVVITGTGFAGLLAVRFGTTATTFTADSSTQITAIAPPGTGTVPVTVTTLAGTSNGVSYTYVSVPAVPTVASIIPSTGPVTGGTLVTLTGTGFTGATAVSFGATPATSYFVLSDNLLVALSPAGIGTVQVTVTTAAGTSTGVPFTYVPVPTLTSISPNSGPVTGGTTVTLTGTGFTGATAVRFGILPATSFTVNSDTQITAVTPVGLGTVAVTVTTAGGTSNGVPYTYVPLPILISLIPNSGSSAGGTTVTLTGVGLTGATGVNFGSTPATSFTVVSDTQITAVAPAGVGTVQVTVTTAAGTSNGLPFTYVSVPAVPIVASITPNSGPAFGGTLVILTGTGFTGASAVSFGATPATLYFVLSDTLIIALAPAGAGTVQVTVTTAAGTSNGVSFTYV